MSRLQFSIWLWWPSVRWIYINLTQSQFYLNNSLIGLFVSSMRNPCQSAWQTMSQCGKDCVWIENCLYPLGDMTLLLTYSRHVVWGAFLWARTMGFLSSWLLWFYSDNKRYKTFTFLEIFSHRNTFSELYQLNSKCSCRENKILYFSYLICFYFSETDDIQEVYYRSEHTI